MAESVPVLICISDDHLGRFDEVTESLRSRGLVVEHALAEVGTIVGSLDDAALSAVSELEGVASVERQRGVRTRRS